MRGHPNAAAGLVAGALTVIAVWIAGIAGLEVPAEVASAFTTLVTGAILFAGKRLPPRRGRR